MELISILMPAYNAGEFIADSIRSVIEQTYVHWELIIINDGSTDNTLSIAQSFSNQDHRIRVISRENGKMAAARNTGIANARGSWIAFLDSDDLWTPDKLEKQIHASRVNPAIDVFYTDGSIFYGNDLERLDPYRTITGIVFDHKDMYRQLFDYNCVAVLSVMARQSLVERVGNQDEDKLVSGCEDWDYWIRMARAGAKFYGIPEKFFYYRRHANNISANFLKMELAKIAVFIRNYDEQFFYKSEGVTRLKVLIYPLINRLLKENKIDECVVILKQMLQILPSFSLRLINKLVKIFHGNAYVPVAIIGKLDRIKLKLFL